MRLSRPALLQASSPATVRVLEWDTRFFGAQMGVIEIDRAHSSGDLAAGIKSAIDSGRRAGYEHLILRCGGDDWDAVWAAEAAGMRLVDAGVDLKASLLPGSDGPSTSCRPWIDDDLSALRAVASTSFAYSRFTVDPFFTAAQAGAFHEQWISNLCRGLADTVLVTGPPGSPLGFVSCSARDGSGRIPLIAVDGRARGSGLGSQLMAEANAWFRDRGMETAWVKTQAQNTPAIRLYGRYGYFPARTEFVFSVAPAAGSGAGGDRP